MSPTQRPRSPVCLQLSTVGASAPGVPNDYTSFFHHQIAAATTAAAPAASRRGLPLLVPSVVPSFVGVPFAAVAAEPQFFFPSPSSAAAPAVAPASSFFPAVHKGACESITSSMSASVEATMASPHAPQLRSTVSSFPAPGHLPVSQPAHRSSIDTPASAVSMCLPHPAQVFLPQPAQSSAKHMVYLLSFEDPLPTSKPIDKIQSSSFFLIHFSSSTKRLHTGTTSHPTHRIHTCVFA